MPRKLVGGLIQCSNPINDESVPVEKIKQAMFDKHVPLIEEAGRKGVQVLCLQEIFNGPYFCPGQDKRWYDAAESVPGPTTDAVAKLAARHRMAVVVPVYEKDMRACFTTRPRSTTPTAPTWASTGRTTSRTRRGSGRSSSSSRGTWA